MSEVDFNKLPFIKSELVMRPFLQVTCEGVKPDGTKCGTLIGVEFKSTKEFDLYNGYNELSLTCPTCGFVFKTHKSRILDKIGKNQVKVVI